MGSPQYPIGIGSTVHVADRADLVRDAMDGIYLASGKVEGHSIVHKFGRNDAVGTSFEPVAMGGVYRTPQVGSATALRVKAGNAADTAAGAGARKVMIQGLDETGALVSEELTTNGTSAGTAGSTTFTRVFRAWVSESGTYATQSAGSHTADVVIENSAGTEDWLTIDATNFPRGQSEVAVYSVPLGKTAYVLSINMSADANQPADVAMFARTNILQSAAPYDAMRMKFQLTGLAGAHEFILMTPMGPYAALTDVGFMAKVGGGTGAVEVDYEILLVDD